MAQLMQPFDATNVDPTQGAGQLPVGRHPVIIESSEVKPNKENSGGYLQLNLQIIDGPNKGQSGAYRLNLYHQNPQTCEIAHRQLSAICHVTGVFRVQDSSQLHSIPFIVDVQPQQDPKYTEVKKVFDINGNEPGKAGTGGASNGAANNGANNNAGNFGGNGGANNNGQAGNGQAGNGQAGAAWGNNGGGQGGNNPPNNTGGGWSQGQGGGNGGGNGGGAPWGQR